MYLHTKTYLNTYVFRYKVKTTNLGWWSIFSNAWSCAEMDQYATFFSSLRKKYNQLQEPIEIALLLFTLSERMFF
jgi:hypothetical protein